MDNKRIMAVPKGYAYAVIAICILGIIVGSFFDYNINVALANKTDIGACVFIRDWSGRETVSGCWLS